MKAFGVFLTLSMALAFAACKDQAATQAEIRQGNPEGQKLRKQYEEAGKQADEQRRKQDQ